MKQVFWFLCASIVPALIGGSLASVAAQTSSPTPDPFTVQLTSTPNAAFNSVMGDMTANGRFVVFVSNGDVSTEKVHDGRNNADGNREIFLADYAQRRIFQITNTRNVPNPSPSPAPTPSASPTPTPAPTPADLRLAKIEIDNRSPMISLAPVLTDGQRVYTIVFSSNAPTPKNFDGTEGGLAADGNSEIWIYKLPAVSDVDLTLGAELIRQDLATGAFDQITDTKASRLPTPGSSTAAPFFADDNREPAISDDGNLLAFISTRNPGSLTTNNDGNPELFFYNVADDVFTQATITQDPSPQIGRIFQSNPSLSSDGSRVAFVSSANKVIPNDANNSNTDNNAEVFVADFGAGGLSNIRQVTRTQNGVTVANVLSPGRRLSRNGALIAFESRATDPKANAAVTNSILGLFVYTIATDTFVEVGTRPQFDDLFHFPTFTDYNGSLAPATLAFVSRVNFRPDGTLPPTAQASEGLNPTNSPQLFVTSVPVSTSGPFTRVTATPNFNSLGSLRFATSDTRKRIAFALGGVDFGSGNPDFSIEIFYLLTPTITAQSAAVLSFFTGASNMPVTAPVASPTPTPSPVPGAPFGLAAGELSIVRSTVALAPSDAFSGPGEENVPGADDPRSPALPIELNGVSLSVNGAAAGLYFVGNTSKQINFVMPITLAPGLDTVAINVLDAAANTDTLHRGFVQIIAGQPDIFTSTNDAGGRAMAFNVTDGKTRLLEPFSVTSPDASGTVVPTVIELDVTGLRFAQPAEITVTIGTTAITGAQILVVRSNPKMPGFDIVNFTLPASLAGAGDVPIVVTFTRGGLTTSSRPAATAPHITIN